MATESLPYILTMGGHTFSGVDHRHNGPGWDEALVGKAHMGQTLKGPPGPHVPHRALMVQKCPSGPPWAGSNGPGHAGL